MRFLKYWLPVVVWAAIILAASGDLFSAEHSGSVLATLFGGYPHWLNFVIRKLSHLTAYAILGALALRAARVDLRHPFVTALTIALVVAIADETHQAFVPRRTGSVGDVALDLAGAGVGAVVVRRRGLSSRA